MTTSEQKLSTDYEELPLRLRKFVVAQDYSRYTPIDQAVWRYILRQLKNYLTIHAHESYEEGLKKTGIDTEEIPRVENISKALKKFGWQAVPVSGFIPPSVFMELQSLGYLPIAAEMRTLDHIHYTPSPDIIHEAAGHAPIISNPEYAKYLKDYAQVSKKALISCEDLKQYDAIRILSDLKENPNSTLEEIKQAEDNLIFITKNISYISEAALLSRMNWWTAEYGLIGSTENPKIFGAGLLSSIGESRDCLKQNVKKISLSIDCLQYAYDITEPQPQLFITPDFKTLTKILNDLKEKMAFTCGGLRGLEEAQRAQSINTVELNTGLQISGKLVDFLKQDDQPIYFRFEGPTQICYENKQLGGHDSQYHQHGYSTPIGLIKNHPQCLSKAPVDLLEKLGLIEEKNIFLDFESGIQVSGILKNKLKKNNTLLILSFEQCSVSYKDQILFQPEWGVFDMALGQNISSVYSGPADSDSYTSSLQPPPVKTLRPRQYTNKQQQLHNIYQVIRDVRTKSASATNNLDSQESILKSSLDELDTDFPQDWLARLEIYELTLHTTNPPEWSQHLVDSLEKITQQDPDKEISIRNGLKLAHSL